MPRFMFKKDCMWGGAHKKQGDTVEVRQATVDREKKLGNHRETGKPLSALLNHAEMLPDPKPTKGDGKKVANV